MKNCTTCWKLVTDELEFNTCDHNMDVILSPETHCCPNHKKTEPRVGFWERIGNIHVGHWPNRIVYAIGFAAVGTFIIGLICLGSAALDMFMSIKGWSDPWYIPPLQAGTYGALGGFVLGALAGYFKEELNL